MTRNLQSRRKPKRKTLLQRPVLWGVAVLLIIIAGSTAWWWAQGNSANIALNAAFAAPVSKGSPDAPVVMVEYADFQCDVCAVMALQVTPQLVLEYVDAGKLRMEYRHYVHKGEESLWAGMASECANEQGMFWEYHDVLFDAQRAEPDSGAFTNAKLKNYAKQLGLDSNAFDACLASGRYLAKIRSDSNEARARGATGTPTMFINDTRFGGLPPMNVLRQVIEQELAK